MPEPDYWTPEPIWSGQQAHILASGPSATPDLIESLRGGNVIVINSTVLSAPWAPVWFFQDWAAVLDRVRGQFVPRLSRDGIDMAARAASFAGLAVTTAWRAKEAVPQLRLVRSQRMAAFLPSGSPVIRHGRSSGQTAIALAIAFGATRIDLHGFDMRAVDGREHHHREYEGRQRDVSIYARDFLPAFHGWHAAALAVGVSIVNATPGSALREFPLAGTADRSR